MINDSQTCQLQSFLLVWHLVFLELRREASSFKESLRFSCIKTKNLWPGQLWRNLCVAFSLSHPEGKQTNKHLSQEQTKPNKQQKPKQNPQNWPSNVLSFNHLWFSNTMPLGNPTHRFSANKEWFLLRTNSLLISKARPTHQWIPVLCMQSPRSETTGEGWPGAQDMLWRGCFTYSFSLYSGAVFSPRRCPGFPRGCSTFLASPAAIYSRNNLPRQMSAIRPFCALHLVLRPGAGGEEAAAKHGCVLPLPGPGLNLSQCCFQYFTENQIQLVLLDLFSMEAQGGLFAALLVLRKDFKTLTAWADPASSGLAEKKYSLCQAFMLSVYI